MDLQLFWIKDAYFYLGENHATECFYRDKEVEIIDFLRSLHTALVAYRIPPEKFKKLFDKLYEKETKFWSGYTKADPELFPNH